MTRRLARLGAALPLTPLLALTLTIGGCAHGGSRLRLQIRPETRWAMIVLSEGPNGCTLTAGPLRVGASQGDPISWEVFNKCRSEVAVAIANLRYLGPRKDRPNPEPRTGSTRDSAADTPAASQSDTSYGPRNDPFDPGDRREKRVGVSQPGRPELLTLRVRRNAIPGVYSYAVLLNGRVVADPETDVWPPDY